MQLQGTGAPRASEQAAGEPVDLTWTWQFGASIVAPLLSSRPGAAVASISRMQALSVVVEVEVDVEVEVVLAATAVALIDSVATENSPVKVVVTEPAALPV